MSTEAWIGIAILIGIVVLIIVIGAGARKATDSSDTIILLGAAGNSAGKSKSGSGFVNLMAVACMFALWYTAMLMITDFGYRDQFWLNEEIHKNQFLIQVGYIAVTGIIVKIIQNSVGIIGLILITGLVVYVGSLNGYY